MPLLLTSIRLAARALARNTLRTGLTMLGIIIGVGAVVTMAALGNGAQQTVETDVRSAGTNLVHVRAGNYTRGGDASNIPSGLGAATTLTADDAGAIAAEVSGVRRETPIVRLRGWTASGERRFYAQIVGTGEAYAEIYGWSFARGGRYFEAGDVAARGTVAVLGPTVRDRLFGEGTNPVGRTISIRDRAFTVAGVARGGDENQIESVFVPYTTLQDLLGISHLHGITVEAVHAGDATRLASDITSLLRRRHRAHIEAASAAVSRLRQAGILGNQMPQDGGAAGPPDDFTVRTQASEALTKGLYTSVAAFVLANMPKLDDVNLQEMASTLQRAGTTMTALLAGIAAISLIVGGIGIMNIMLVSVTERTREIGIRMAIGARPRDVMTQFLVEAVMLSVLGGIVGILLGVGGGVMFSLLTQTSFVLSPLAVLLAFGFAGAVGIVFGFYPARRAARLDPIVALRTE